MGDLTASRGFFQGLCRSVWLAAALGGILPLMTAQAAEPEVVIPYVTVTPVIDGKLDEACWAKSLRSSQSA